MASSAKPSNLTPIDLSVHQKRAQQKQPSFWSRLTWRDGVFAVLMIALFSYGGLKNLGLMDVYEKGILVGSVISIVLLGWFWLSASVDFRCGCGHHAAGDFVVCG